MRARRGTFNGQTPPKERNRRGRQIHGSPGLQARYGVASFDACRRASPRAGLDPRLVGMESVSVPEALGDIPHSWIVSLVHLERNAARFSVSQFDVLREKLHDDGNLFVAVADQLSSQIDVLHNEECATGKYEAVMKVAFRKRNPQREFWLLTG